MLTCSGRLTHVSGHPLAAGWAQDRERPPTKDRRSTTEPTPPTLSQWLLTQGLRDCAACDLVGIDAAVSAVTPFSCCLKYISTKPEVHDLRQRRLGEPSHRHSCNMHKDFVIINNINIRYLRRLWLFIYFERCSL